MRPDRLAERMRPVSGFSLLEMVVAIAILAMALAALYQAAGGASRNVRSDERYAYGVEIARSLLALNSSVPEEGLSSEGVTGDGYRWQVYANPIDLQRTRMQQGLLQAIEVRVVWKEGSKQRQVVLNSVVEGMLQ